MHIIFEKEFNMKKNDTQSKLRLSLNEEEKVVQHKKIGIDKFSKADIVFGKKKDVRQEIKSKAKLLPGKRKTIYLSQTALGIIKQLGSRLRLLDIESNDSKVITTALCLLNTLDNETLRAKTTEVD